MRAESNVGIRAAGEALARDGRAVAVSHAMPARLRARLHIAGSGGSVEPVVMLQGTLAFSSPRARVIFRSHPLDPGRPEEGVTREARLVPSGARLVPRWSPVRGIAGRSRLSLQLADFDGRPLGPEQDFGECSDGVREIQAHFVLEANVRASVSAREWHEPEGPSIAVDGELMFPRGVILKLGFSPLGTRTERMRGSVSDVQLIHPGFAMYSSEKRFDSGLRDHTWVSILFIGEAGRPIVDEQVVGCCVHG